MKVVFFKSIIGSEGHVALDGNPGPGYDTLLLRLIPGDPCREAVRTIFMMVFGMTRPEGELTTYRVRDEHANH